MSLSVFHWISPSNRISCHLEKLSLDMISREKNHKWHQRTKFILLLFCPDKQAYFASLSSVWSCFGNSGSKNRTSLTVAFEPTTPTQLGSLNKVWGKWPKYLQKSHFERRIKISEYTYIFRYNGTYFNKRKIIELSEPWIQLSFSPGCKDNIFTV